MQILERLIQFFSVKLFWSGQIFVLSVYGRIKDKEAEGKQTVNQSDRYTDREATG